MKIIYKKLSNKFSPKELKSFYDKAFPGKSLGQCSGMLKKSSIIGAFNENSLIGIGRSLDDTVYGFITDIIVNKDYQKHGIGSEIVEMIIKELIKNNVKLIHCSTNTELINFYKAIGFKHDKDNITMYFKNF